MVAAIQVEGYQLAPQQRRLWPLVRAGAAPNALLALSIEGELDVERLRSVVQQTVETHETLRTIYAEHRETNSVVQIVSDALFEWRVSSDQFERIWLQEQERRIAPFQLPQLRATLVKISPASHMLVLATTILAADARSLDNLGRWIAAAYNDGEKLEPELQYVQYAEWKNENHGSIGLETDPRHVDRLETFGFELRSNFSERQLFETWRALLERWMGKADVVVVDSKREFDELNDLVGRFSSGGGAEFGFSFEHGAARKWEGKIVVCVWRRQSVAGQFRLMLQCEDRGDVLHVELQFDPARFSRATIEDMAESYQRLLVSLPIVGPRAQQRLLEFSRGSDIDAAPRCIEEMFREQVRRTPQASAVVFEDQKLTYAELDAASDALAAHLIDQGVTIDTPVAIRLERSLDLMVAIMGVLKSGGAYVPIDPTFPEPRIERMLSDCGAKIVLTIEEIRKAGQHQRWPSADVERAMRTGDPRGLAYIIYTSGSTGEAKGVCVEHRQVTHYVRALIDRHPMLAGCSFASVSTIAADLGNTAIFTALLTGGCLHLISRERATDGARFADYLATHDVDAVKIVPSHFSALADSIDLKSVLPKRCIVFGGEQLTTRINDVTVINHYGPTETTIGTTTCEIANDISIGRPLPGTQAYILDEHLNLMPHGVAGELFIGGDGVARGYCNRPDLTAEKFIPDPFAQRGGRRLYRTGDRARFNENGNLVFEGRRDRQVKIAGFRIELGEIEAALKDHPAISDAVVVAESDPKLVAYVASKASANDVRAFLSSRLPAHMVPAAIHIVSHLPLTSNGKLDHAALRERARPREITEPSDPIAKQIREICVALIDNAGVDVDDNLLDLGVSSLKAMQLLARLRAAFNIALPLSAIFEKPTVNGLAGLIRDELVREIAQLSDEEVQQRIQAYQSK
ncbi:MAG TPA: non-ribosomal peptide synthetase [Pyrinomonadaceae bacterium]|nr:non-ribosomal peptide synthetase [Pyrinomonadaceae bacterium]